MINYPNLYLQLNYIKSNSNKKIIINQYVLPKLFDDDKELILIKAIYFNRNG
jgi:hypothetical protein